MQATQLQAKKKVAPYQTKRCWDGIVTPLLFLVRFCPKKFKAAFQNNWKRLISHTWIACEVLYLGGAANPEAQQKGANDSSCPSFSGFTMNRSNVPVLLQPSYNIFDAINQHLEKGERNQTKSTRTTARIADLERWRVVIIKGKVRTAIEARRLVGFLAAKINHSCLEMKKYVFGFSITRLTLEYPKHTLFQDAS